MSNDELAWKSGTIYLVLNFILVWKSRNMFVFWTTKKCRVRRCRSFPVLLLTTWARLSSSFLLDSFLWNCSILLDGNQVCYLLVRLIVHLISDIAHRKLWVINIQSVQICFSHFGLFLKWQRIHIILWILKLIITWFLRQALLGKQRSSWSEDTILAHATSLTGLHCTTVWTELLSVFANFLFLLLQLCLELSDLNVFKLTLCKCFLKFVLMVSFFLKDFSKHASTRYSEL